MNYLILGKPMFHVELPYRGLYRTEPKYIEDAPLVELWDWYTEETYKNSYVQDLYKAKKLVEAYKKHNINFEIIQVSNQIEIFSKDEFLGIDVATKGNFSVLEQGLIYDFRNKKPEPLDGISELLFNHFRIRLNINLLFEDEADAHLFSKVIKEMQTVCPGYFEIEEFHLFYLYCVI